MAQPNPARRTRLAVAAAPVSAPARSAEPDLVDTILDYLRVAGLLSARDAELDEIASAVREVFAGEQAYIAARPASARQQLAADVLRAFNGRNATELARVFSIGRTTVYRLLKQAGRRAP
jgi:Mor family transcriptional regulator